MKNSYEPYVNIQSFTKYVYYKQILSEVQNLSHKYCVVKPSCGNGCREDFTSRERKVVVRIKTVRLQKKKFMKLNVRKVPKKRRAIGSRDLPQVPLVVGSIKQWLTAMENYWRHIESRDVW